MPREDVVIDSIISHVLTALTTGGIGAQIAIFVAIIAFLVWERNNLNKKLAKKEEKLEKVIQEYYESSEAIASALNSIKLALTKLGNKIK